MNPRRVVSVSLGSPSRDWDADLAELGVPLRIERRGVGRDYDAYTSRLRELDADPSVAAIGLGGINRYLFAGDRRVPLRRAEEMAGVVRRVPVCDGSQLKQHWEPHVVQETDRTGVLPLSGRRVLMVCAVDRWGMAAALVRAGATVILGDLMFGLGLPLPVRSLAGLEKLTRILLPFLCSRVPFEWLYPTGESRDSPRFLRWYAWADVLAGDWKFIARHMPHGPGCLAGKAVLTNTTTPADVEALRERGAGLLITTTPSLGGRSFGTNAVEAAVCAMTGRQALDLPIIREAFAPLGWDSPRVQPL